MASGVSVESAAVTGGIRCCMTSIQEMETAINLLVKNYQKAGSGGWRDQKYIALGGIVEECCVALKKPVGELQACLVKLQKLLEAVQNYESENM